MKRVATLLLVALAWIAIGRAGVRRDSLAAGDPLAEWLRRLATAQDLAVFEGLPHPTWEPTLRAEEAETKPHFGVGGELFYAEPLAIAPGPSRSLQSALGKPATFANVGHVALKLCGGFHADYAVRWTLRDGAAGKTNHLWALVCFGCHEVALLSDDGWSTHADLTDRGYAELGEWLGGLGKHRPISTPAPGRSVATAPAVPRTLPLEIADSPTFRPAGLPPIVVRTTHAHHASSPVVRPKTGFRKGSGGLR